MGSSSSKEKKFIYHTNTTNTSFIKMHTILKDLGVKNNKFFLKLYDKEIQYIDPLDEDSLTEEQKLRVAREIKRNIWYFLREIVRIPVPGNPTGKRYELHRGNLAQTWCMKNNINAAEELPRQNGKTISAECVYLYFYNFKTTNSQIAYFNKKYPDSKMNLQRFKDIRDLLPDYLKNINISKDKNNLTYVRSFKRKNEITAQPTANDVDSADKLGRGSTQPLQWFRSLDDRFTLNSEFFVKIIVKNLILKSCAHYNGDIIVNLI